MAAGGGRRAMSVSQSDAIERRLFIARTSTRLDAADLAALSSQRSLSLVDRRNRKPELLSSARACYIHGGPAKVRPTYIFDGNI